MSVSADPGSDVFIITVSSEQEDRTPVIHTNQHGFI